MDRLVKSEVLTQTRGEMDETRHQDTDIWKGHSNTKSGKHMQIGWCVSLCECAAYCLIPAKVQSLQHFSTEMKLRFFFSFSTYFLDHF